MIGLFFCLIVVLLVKMYVRYKQKKKLSLSEQILADLYALKKENKVQSIYGKEFYLRLSEIIKKYFFYCHEYDVLAKTDAELIDYLYTQHINERTIEEIKDILHGSEIIKFANSEAAQDRIVSDYDRIVFIFEKNISNKVHF
jgi:hypothetical protein